METLPEYNWWGQASSPPPHLKTKKQLSEMGLKPGKPAGVIHTSKYDLHLYDLNQALPKRKPSPEQLEALKRGRKTQESKRISKWEDRQRAAVSAYEEKLQEIAELILQARHKASNWAKRLLQRSDWVILDTETTGLEPGEICQIAIVDHTEKTLLDTLIKPTISIPAEATAIHGITSEMVEDAPQFPEVYPLIREAIGSKLLVIYNVGFDVTFLDACCQLHSLPYLWNASGELKWWELKNKDYHAKFNCAMHWYSQWCGDYSEYHGDFTWQVLGGNHSALDDCLKVALLIKQMGADCD